MVVSRGNAACGGNATFAPTVGCSCAARRPRKRAASVAWERWGPSSDISGVLARISARTALQSWHRMKDGTITDPAGVPSLPTENSPACVVIIHGGQLGRRIPLPPREITIGRDDENAVHLALETISRRHARLFIEAGSHHIEDLGSTNGTFINEEEIARPRRLRNGDLVRCGGAVFKFIEGG